MRRLLKLLVHAVVAGLVISLAVVWSGPAVARTVPETLADRRPAQTGPVTTEFGIDHLGVIWKTPAGHEHADERGRTEPHGAVRLLGDDGWGPWIDLIEDGIQAEGQWASGLVPGNGAKGYQVRGIPADAVDPQVVHINTTDGPPMVVGREGGGAAQALTSSQCRSRADWGADEALRHDASGNEVWAPQFHDAQVATVHHTATTNNDPDPAGTVRAIYRYHAVDQGWGDIGYQYLIDEQGIVYEGRWSGTASTSCGTASGDGREFGHESDVDKDIDNDSVFDEMVTGAHTGGWNSGNLGVALLGEFTTHRRFGAEPKAAAVSTLEQLLAELAGRHGLDPLAEVVYVNPVNGEKRTVPTIGGHRDYQATECPGARLYALLPSIRLHVADLLASSTDGGTTPDGGSLRVADLDGAAAAVARNQWQATVTTTAVDDAGLAVAGAAVEGTWTTTGTAVSCTTGADGSCAVQSPRLSKGTASAAFRVDALRFDGLAYDAAGNDDPDGDSDGTTITVAHPG
ncbi:N-acetylmuramoyl-L-alanine amidase [Kocuria sp. M1R5S2]|uniref:N-acetylmuramoyl-L-alanine amidase n=1 Tax=Kocuria rhizosphaerae TaxID=3376285 RepID=UPI00378D439C